MGASQQFSLRWNNYLRHITCAFDSLRNDENLVDVTLSCEGKKIRAHRMLLSACSTYFQELFKENPCQHPVVIFRNVKFEDLSALVDFMYQGEVNVIQEQLSSFLATAELLAIQGLSDGNGRDRNLEQKQPEMLDTSSATDPETQCSNSHTQSVLNDVSSPMPFFPVDQICDSPPSNKRRKCGSGASGSTVNVGSASNAVHKNTEKPERERRRIPSLNKTSVESDQDPIEIIPVLPNLKVEMPDYDDDLDASSCSYDDTSHGAGISGTHSAMSRLLPTGSSSTSNTKTELSDMYNTNSRDGSESLSATDIGHILSKPGSSGENQSQESLQDPVVWVGDPGKSRTQTNKGSAKEFHCNICEKAFQNVDSLYKHKDVHKGKTQCPICQILLSRMHHLKRHMLCRHGIKLSDIMAPS